MNRYPTLAQESLVFIFWISAKKKKKSFGKEIKAIQNYGKFTHIFIHPPLIKPIFVSWAMPFQLKYF